MSLFITLSIMTLYSFNSPVASLGSLKSAAYVENLKCTEFGNTVDSKVILQVPCVLIRLMEHLKECSIETFKSEFLNTGAPQYRHQLVNTASKIKNKLKKNAKNNQNIKEKNADNLISLLKVTPANLTSSIDDTMEINCSLFAVALRIQLERNQKYASLRSVFRNEYPETSVDESIPISFDAISKRINQFKCTNTLATDESTYFYYKYIFKSISEMVKLNEDSRLNEVDFAVLFIPFIELENKFNRILPSHSILLSILQNMSALFDKDECDRTAISNEGGKGSKKKWFKKSLRLKD